MKRVWHKPLIIGVGQLFDCSHYVDQAILDSFSAHKTTAFIAQVHSALTAQLPILTWISQTHRALIRELPLLTKLGQILLELTAQLTFLTRFGQTLSEFTAQPQLLTRLGQTHSALTTQLSFWACLMRFFHCSQHHNHIPSVGLVKTFRDTLSKHAIPDSA